MFTKSMAKDKKLTIEEWLKEFGNGAEFTSKRSQRYKQNGIVTTWIVEGFHPKGRPKRVTVTEFTMEESAHQYVFFLRLHYEEAK